MVVTMASAWASATPAALRVRLAFNVSKTAVVMACSLA